MTLIREADFIQSIADALQYISYYHPVDFIQALNAAYQKEQSPAAKDAMAQILINSRLCAEGHRPICQDTGIVTVFLKVGMDVKWASQLSVLEMVNQGVHGCQHVVVLCHGYRRHEMTLWMWSAAVRLPLSKS